MRIVFELASGLQAVHRLGETHGGVNPATAEACREAGCDVLVAASAIFKSPAPPEEPSMTQAARYKNSIELLRGVPQVSGRS